MDIIKNDIFYRKFELFRLIYQMKEGLNFNNSEDFTKQSASSSLAGK